MQLEVLSDRFAVCRLSPDADFPVPNVRDTRAVLWSLTRTPDELSLVCPDADIPQGCLAVERGWRALVVAGPLDFSLVGILASLTGTLAAANISIFALSTFDTDYLLVKENDLERAVIALKDAGNPITYRKTKTR